jgi:leader peptidase (prepilin peptidase)/N-methyltransferase
LAAVFGGLLMAGFTLAMLVLECQHAEMVRPDPVWKYGRIVYHAVLLWLLLVATITDLRDYVIPDQITVPGMLLGLGLATASGDLQMMHLWMDWNQAQPGVFGAYIPDWIKEHRHLHGLAWSLAGLVAGAGLTWLVRWTSAWILGRQALGFGDVTLMAMIGSFLGWQATLCVFLIAPVCGIVVALVTWICTGRGFVPYGPYLALATVVVLFTWRWIWEPSKETFGDAKSLIILATVGFATLLALLGILRFYWSIPVESSRRSPKSHDDEG